MFDVWLWLWFELVFFDLSWFDLSWFGLIVIVIWVGWFVWFELVWFVLVCVGLSWFDLVWVELIWFELSWFLATCWPHEIGAFRLLSGSLTENVKKQRINFEIRQQQWPPITISYGNHHILLSCINGIWCGSHFLSTPILPCVVWSDFKLLPITIERHTETEQQRALISIKSICGGIGRASSTNDPWPQSSDGHILNIALRAGMLGGLAMNVDGFSVGIILILLLLISCALTVTTSRAVPWVNGINSGIVYPVLKIQNAFLLPFLFHFVEDCWGSMLLVAFCVCVNWKLS